MVCKLNVVCVCSHVHAQSLSYVPLFATPWTVQAPLSMERFRKEYWSGMPFTSPGDLKPASLASPALVGRLFTNVPPGKPSQGGKLVQSQAHFFPSCKIIAFHHQVSSLLIMTILCC